MSDWNSELPEDMNLDEMIPLSTDSVVTVSEDRMMSSRELIFRRFKR